MRSVILSSLWIIFFTTLQGCGPGSNRTSGSVVADKPAEPGKIVSSVTCRRDYKITYALYLPKSYSIARKFPVILAFDPHGSGVLPLEKYKDLADKYGYVMMGSNDSKNGQDMNTTGAIIDALMGETAGRYSTDSTRVYVMGFSGGARVAAIIGLYQGGVAGMIACGAGFPGTNQPVRFKPDFISIAGNADFNMNELINLDHQLDGANFTHAMIVFNGKHEWPPVDVMEKAFIWTEFCSMRKGLIPKNEAMILGFTRSQEKLITADKASGDVTGERDHLVNLVRFVDGLMPTDDFKKTLAEVVKSPAYKLKEKQSQELAGKEMKEQQALNSKFFSNDIDWWRKKISNYESRIHKGKDSSDVRMCKRLKSYLSLLCYMNYTRVLSSHDTMAANHAMSIYEMADPENAASTKAGKVK